MSASPISAQRLARRGTPASALRLARRPAADAESPEVTLEAPAFEDMSRRRSAIEITDGASAEEPSDTNAPSRRADPSGAGGRFGR